ncbi:hypothetical protein J4221_02255 [Candidatus Pacearchaeota archaeon]|nr:hypothetical protein [Candidatus Pacearchaeota archaeon]
MKKENEKSLYKRSYQKLNALKFGIAGGIITSLFIFVITIGGIFNYCIECTSLVSAIYDSLGYSITLIGAFIGATYAFIDGFVISWLFAFIYNKLIH